MIALEIIEDADGGWPLEYQNTRILRRKHKTASKSFNQISNQKSLDWFITFSTSIATLNHFLMIELVVIGKNIVEKEQLENT